MGSGERETIRRLYLFARRSGRALDYYAASDEYEYFAQGYEAFVSTFKRPGTGLTARHTRRELSTRDPGLYSFLVAISRRPFRQAAPQPADRRSDRRFNLALGKVQRARARREGFWGHA